MKRRKLLLFHASADLYGSDRTVLDLVEGLAREDWETHVALPGDGPLVPELRALGASVSMDGFTPFGRSSLTPTGIIRLPLEFHRSTRGCRALIRAQRPDLIHVNTLVIPAPALAARRARLPLVWHVHEIMERPAVVARQLLRLVGRWSTRVVCNSRATLEWLREHDERAGGKASLIWNGVHRPPQGDRARAALGLKEEDFVVLYVGRLNAWKGQLHFVRAAGRLQDRFPSLRFLVAGDCPPAQEHYREEFLREVRSAGLGERLQWFGFREDVHELYRAADLLVVPSLLPEPFGLVAAEAMAHALPVVAAAHGGLAEIVESGETGILYPPGDLEALVEAVASLVADPEKARSMGRAGAARQRLHYSVERYQEQFLDLYRELIPTP